MTVQPIDLADILAHHYTQPAPTAGPQDPDVITSGGPWQPRTVPFKACGCGVLTGEDCDCVEMLAQLEQANRRPILIDLRRAA